MQRSEKYITGVEFGNEKICVIHAIVHEDGTTEICSFVAKPSKDSMYKGEIKNVNTACEIMREAIDESEQSLSHMIDRSDQQIYCLVSGPKIVSKQGAASIQITSPSKKVSVADLQAVTEQATRNMFFPDMQQIATIDGYFYIDDSVRETDVIGKIANKLTTHPHIVFAPTKQIETIRKIFDELGFEKPVFPVYSPIAASFAALTNDEREHGALLFDYGYGVCTYAFVYQEGILLSGCIPVGVSNIANDLHVGLDLPYDFCLTFIKENRLSKLRAQGQNFVEYQNANKVRKVPLDSFEKIINLRLRETFNLMHDKLESTELLHTASNTSLVLIGGGALIDSACDTMRDIFQLPIRCGGILDNTTGIDVSLIRPPCCCSAIVGLMKNVSDFGYESGTGNIIVEKLSRIGDAVGNAIKTIFKG